MTLFPVEARGSITEEAFALFDEGIRRYITDEGKTLTAVCILFSGGNDSTVLAHLFRNRANYAAHANTGIGVEATRQFVRDTCAAWSLPLIEESPPPGSTYEELVIERGFPGPAMHGKMYQRLKERALKAVRRQFVTNPRKERIVFLAGRRRNESARRTARQIPEMERTGSIVWISPLVHWTARDMSDYRAANPDVPTNEVSSLIHMSGECLCGAFAKKGEREEVGFWFPEVENAIQRLERLVRDAGHPEPLCRWGWGADDEQPRDAVSGRLCSSCDNRYQLPLWPQQETA